jgi:putative transposase
VVIGVTVNGERDILGLWAGDGGEGAKFWLGVLTELKNRGVADVCIVVCDGLKGLPDSITTTWSYAQVQACILHLIRNTFRYASRHHWEELARDLKPIYTAPTAEAAEARLGDLAAKWSSRYPAIIALWRNAWAGSSGALPRRSPLRTGRASHPRIRLKQARGCHGQKDWRAGARCGARPCGRNGCAGAVRRPVHPAMRGAGQR